MVFHNPQPTFCSGALIMSADIQSRMVCERGDREKLRRGGSNNSKNLIREKEKSKYILPPC